MASLWTIFDLEKIIITVIFEQSLGGNENLIEKVET